MYPRGGSGLLLYDIDGIYGVDDKANFKREIGELGG